MIKSNKYYEEIKALSEEKISSIHKSNYSEKYK